MARAEPFGGYLRFKKEMDAFLKAARSPKDTQDDVVAPPSKRSEDSVEERAESNLAEALQTQMDPGSKDEIATSNIQHDSQSDAQRIQRFIATLQSNAARVGYNIPSESFIVATVRDDTAPSGIEYQVTLDRPLESFKDRTNMNITNAEPMDEVRDRAEKRIKERMQRLKRIERFSTLYTYPSEYNTRGKRRFINSEANFHRLFFALPVEVQDDIWGYVVLIELEDEQRARDQRATEAARAAAASFRPGHRRNLAQTHILPPYTPVAVEILRPKLPPTMLAMKGLSPALYEQIVGVYFKMGFELFVDLDHWSAIEKIPQRILNSVKKIHAVLTFTASGWRDSNINCINFIMGAGDKTFPSLVELELDLRLIRWHGGPVPAPVELRPFFKLEGEAFPKLNRLKLTTHKNSSHCSLCWQFQLMFVNGIEDFFRLRAERLRTERLSAELFQVTSSGRNVWIWEAKKPEAPKQIAPPPATQNQA